MMQNPNLNVPLTQYQSIPVQKETLSKKEKIMSICLVVLVGQHKKLFGFL